MLKLYYSRHCKFCTLAKAYLELECPSTEFILTSLNNAPNASGLPLLQAFDAEGRFKGEIEGFCEKAKYQSFVDEHCTC